MYIEARKAIALGVLMAFLISSVQSPAYAQLPRQSILPWMPTPGVLLNLSPGFTPAHLKGIVIHPDNALKFDFIVYKGDSDLTESQKKQEYLKLVKYFLASLAVPDENQWVNLSPYEKNRIIKDDFGKTEMGRDLLAQDYILKQITASLIYPKLKLGQEFWDRVYADAQRQYGTSNIPVNTYNKVWILPDDAVIYEKGNTAYVLRDHLKVMLEEDYLSLKKHEGLPMRSPSDNQAHSIASKIVKDIILPALEKEINEGRNFSTLRQVYSGMLLAAWYKHALKESLLGKIYADKSRLQGVDQDPRVNEAIYRQYLKAYRKGVFNFIREDVDKYTHETVPRKYFSGGTEGFNVKNYSKAVHVVTQPTPDQDAAMAAEIPKVDLAQVVVNEAPAGHDAAMTLQEEGQQLQKMLGDIFPSSVLSESGIQPLEGYPRKNDILDQEEHRFKGTFFANPKKERPENVVHKVEKLLEDLQVFQNKNAKVYVFNRNDGLIEKLGDGSYGLELEISIILTARPVQPSIPAGLQNMMIASIQLNKLSRNSRLMDILMSLHNSKDDELVNDFHAQITRTGQTDLETARFLSFLLRESRNEISNLRELLEQALTDILNTNRLNELAGRNLARMQALPPTPQPVQTIMTPSERLENTYRVRIGAFQYVLAADDKAISDALQAVVQHGKGQDGIVAELAQIQRISTAPGSLRLNLKKRLVGLLIDGRKAGWDALQWSRIENEASPGTQAPSNRPASDKAALSNSPDKFTRGGIDLNAANLNLQIRRDGAGVPLPISRQDLEKIHINGLVPVILDIKPAVGTSLLSQLQISHH
jgi:hypothetical protein